MIRYDVIRQLLPELRGRLVICNIGFPSQELYSLQDEDSNFYMLGTMGLCSSIGLGLALTQNDTVIAIDGDGSVLTNLATLATIANNPSENFILVIIDNGSYGSTGDQPTYTGKRTSLAAVSEACGCENVIECPAEETASEVKKAIASRKMTVVVSRCESGNVPLTPIDLDPVVIRHRFMTEVAKRNA